MELTRDNYFSPEAEWYYMGRSQFEGFLECEAKAMAKLRGEIPNDKTTALLAGTMLHAWNEGPHAMQRFLTENKSDVMTQKGELRADFKTVQNMIQTLETDPMVLFVLNGQKEVPLTANLFGIPWKIMLDSYNPAERRIGELKSTRDIRTLIWSDADRCKTSFLEAWGYMRQAALYSEVERLAAGRAVGDYLEMVMVACSKEDPPDHEIISLLDPNRFELELKIIEAHIERVVNVKTGAVEPTSCGKCAWCRSQYKVTRIKHYTELAEAI